MLTTRFTGGPWDGKTTLGRVRPGPSDFSKPVDASGPATITVTAPPGEYVRTTDEGATVDEYTWHPAEAAA